MQPDPVALRGRGHEQRAVEALVVRAHPQCLPNRPFGLVPATELHEHRRHPRSAVRTTNDSMSDWVPSKTAQSVRRNPEKSGPRTSRMASRSWRGSSEEASAANRSTSVVTEPPRSEMRRHGEDAAGRRRPDPAPGGRPRRSNARWRGGRPLGPDRQGPLGVTHAAPVEGEVDHELERSRAMERSGSAADDDRTEDRDFDACVRSRRGTVGGALRRAVDSLPESLSAPLPTDTSGTFAGSGRSPGCSGLRPAHSFLSLPLSACCSAPPAQAGERAS